MEKINFFSADRKVNVRKRKSIKNFLSQIFKIEKTQLQELKFIFCSDNYLLNININYLHHNFFTDVISFNLSDTDKLVNGEIYLSIDRIEENAKFFLVSYEKELLRVMIHGSLHLCGYKDDTSKSKKYMSEKEDYFLNLFYRST